MNQSELKTIDFGKTSLSKMQQQKFSNIIHTEGYQMTASSIKQKISFLGMHTAKLRAKLKDKKNSKVAQILGFQMRLKEALERKERNLEAIQKYSHMIRQNQQKKTQIEHQLTADFISKREALKTELKRLSDEVSELADFESKKVA